MPTSATGTSTEAPRAARGFSLLELLVVVLLIGIILTMATLAIGPGVRRVDSTTEADRLAALLQLAREQAVLQGIEHGLEVHRDGYRVLAQLDARWVPFDVSPWRPHTLPDGIRLDLVVDGYPIELPDAPAAAPQLLLFSSGETTPFEIELSGPARICRLTGEGLADLPPPVCEAT